MSKGLGFLITGAKRRLEELQYRPRTRRYYEAVWRALQAYVAAQRLKPQFTPRVAAAFLASCGVAEHARTNALAWRQEMARRAVGVLLDLQATGDFRRNQRPKSEPVLPAAFRCELASYEEFCARHLHHRHTTIAGRRRTVEIFLSFLESRGIVSPTGLAPDSLVAFIQARGRQIRRSSLANEVGQLRSFLRYLAMKGLVAPDLVAHARALRFQRDHQLPPVWPQGAVEMLLAAVDRSSVQGKRDYAILLLACRLGLRASDIRGLRLDDVCWREGRINLRQRKTDYPLSLPLDAEVGEALIDYLAHGRPEVDHREVFIKVRGPREPLGQRNTLYSVLASALERAPFELPTGLPRGLHALRHTLATELVRVGERLETISGILGHRSVESTRVYTHLDVDALRCVALDPEEVLNA
jgi:site-specific recombinase XerD